MANGSDANAIWKDSIKKVVRKAFQIRSAKVPQVRAKSQRTRSGGFNVSFQFSPELVSKANIVFVIATQGTIDILLNRGVIPDLHLPRSASTRRMNSSCEISLARPLSRSESRCKTSSSETSGSSGARVSNSETV